MSKKSKIKKERERSEKAEYLAPFHFSPNGFEAEVDEQEIELFTMNIDEIYDIPEGFEDDFLIGETDLPDAEFVNATEDIHRLNSLIAMDISSTPGLGEQIYAQQTETKTGWIQVGPPQNGDKNLKPIFDPKDKGKKSRKVIGFELKGGKKHPVDIEFDKTGHTSRLRFGKECYRPTAKGWHENFICITTRNELKEKPGNAYNMDVFLTLKGIGQISASLSTEAKLGLELFGNGVEEKFSVGLQATLRLEGGVTGKISFAVQRVDYTQVIERICYSFGLVLDCKTNKLSYAVLAIKTVQTRNWSKLHFRQNLPNGAHKNTKRIEVEIDL